MKKTSSHPKTQDWYKRRWLSGAKYRARKAGVIWNLKPEDVYVPEHCPVLGIPLAFGGGNTHDGRTSSPSLDRIDPDLGYVPSNVVVVSHLANSIRFRAKPQQIALVASYYGQLLPTED